MKITCLGCGEAFDGNYPNNAYLIESEHTFLLDCGYTIPPQVWLYNDDPNFLDAIYISHGHADHYFGLPPLLTRFWEQERTQPLTVISQPGLIPQIKDVIDFGYQGIREKLSFDLHFAGVTDKKGYSFEEFHCQFAPTNHSIPNLAIRINVNDKVVCYSGDGNFTPQSQQLFEGADLLIQETYMLDTPLDSHGSIQKAIEVAQQQNIKRLALSHINREVRQKKQNAIDALLQTTQRPILYCPVPFDTLPC